MIKRATKTAKLRIAMLEKKQAALEYRKQGYTAEEIANIMGCSTTTIYNYITKALNDVIEDTKETTEQMRILESKRLDDMYNAVYEDAEKGDQGAINTMIKIMDRKAKLWGLDKPFKIAETDSEGEDKEQKPQTNVNINFDNVEDAAKFYQEMIAGDKQ